MPLTSMLQIIDDKALNIQAIENKKNQKVPSGTTKAGFGGVSRVGGSIENLSSGTEEKRSSGADFLTSGVKEAFIHL